MHCFPLQRMIAGVLLGSLILGGLSTEAKTFTVDADLLSKFSTLKGRERQMFLWRIYQDRNEFSFDRSKMGDKLIELMRSKETDNQCKCGVAFLVGVFQLRDCTDVLVENFMLWNQEAGGPDALNLVEGEWPAQQALIRLGRGVVPRLIEVIETSTNDYVRKASAHVIFYASEGKEGKQALGDALNAQTEPNKKERLQEALNFQIFKQSNSGDTQRNVTGVSTSSLSIKQSE